jgi:hypothetical protein
MAKPAEAIMDDQPARGNDEIGSPMINLRVDDQVSSTPRAETDHSLIRGDLGGYSFMNLPNEKEPTHPPNPTQDAPTDAQRSVTLLIDPAIGMTAAKAKELAAAYPFEHILRHVAAWWSEHRRAQLGPGVLAYRIVKGNSPPAVGRAFRETELFERHGALRPLCERIATADVPDVDFYAPPDPPPTRPAPPPPDPTDPWPVVLVEAKAHVSDGIARWLDGARLVQRDAVDNTPHFQVVLPADADARAVESRCLRSMRFSLGMFLKLKQQPLVTFVPSDRVPSALVEGT